MANLVTVFLCRRIPFFVLFISRLKLLVSNLKSIGLAAKISLFVVWIASIVGLSVIGFNQFGTGLRRWILCRPNRFPFETEIRFPSKWFPTNAMSTMHTEEELEYWIQWEWRQNHLFYQYTPHCARYGRFHWKDFNQQKAQSHDFLSAKSGAEAINYSYALEENKLLLDAYLTTDIENKYRDQRGGSHRIPTHWQYLVCRLNTYSFHSNDYYHRDLLHHGDESHYLLIEDGTTHCLDCPEEETESWEEDVKAAHDRKQSSTRFIPYKRYFTIIINQNEHYENHKTTLILLLAMVCNKLSLWYQLWAGKWQQQCCYRRTPVKDFSAVHGSARVDVYLTGRAENKVVVEADENLLDIITTSVEGNAGNFYGKSIGAPKSKKFTLLYKKLESIEASKEPMLLEIR